MLESLFNKFAELKARNYIKKRLQHRLVFCEYFHIFHSIFFAKHVQANASEGRIEI